MKQFIFITNLNAVLLPTSNEFQDLKSSPVGPLSAAEAIECIAHNIQSVKKKD